MIGTSSAAHTCTTMRTVISHVISFPLRSSSAAIPSGPGAFFVGSEYIASRISSSEGGMPPWYSLGSAGRSPFWYNPCQNCLKFLMSYPCIRIVGFIFFRRCAFSCDTISHAFSAFAHACSACRWSLHILSKFRFSRR